MRGFSRLQTYASSDHILQAHRGLERGVHRMQRNGTGLAAHDAVLCAAAQAWNAITAALVFGPKVPSIPRGVVFHSLARRR